MAASRADVVLQVAERLLGRLVVGVQHLGGDLGIAQAVQQRHALGRPQHHIERRHPMVAVRAAEQLSVSGWRPWNIRTNASVLATPSWPKAAALRPSQRPGDSPWPDRYSSRFSAT